MSSIKSWGTSSEGRPAHYQTKFAITIYFGFMNLFFQEDTHVGHSTRNAFSALGICFEHSCIGSFTEPGQCTSLYCVPVQRTASEDCKRRGDPPGSERQTGDRRSVVSARNHIIAGRDAACPTSPRAQRNVAHSGRHRTAHKQWHKPRYRPGLGGICSFQR